MAVLRRKKSYGAVEDDGESEEERRSLVVPLVVAVVGLFWVGTASLVVRGDTKAPQHRGRHHRLSRRARREVDRALRQRGRDLRHFFDLLNFEKKYLGQWGAACATLFGDDFVDDAAAKDDDFCGDYDAFCPTLCPPGSRCGALCGDACDEGWGAFCVLSLFHRLGDADARLCDDDSATTPPPTRLLLEPPRRVSRLHANLSTWLNDTNCAAHTVCRACNAMDSWGCQKATHAAAAQYWETHQDDRTILAEYDFDPRRFPPHHHHRRRRHHHRSRRGAHDDASSSSSLEDDGLVVAGLLPDDDDDVNDDDWMNATDAEALLASLLNASLVDPFLRLEVWPLVPAQLEGDHFDDLCRGPLTFPGLPPPPPILDARFTTFPFEYDADGRQQSLQ